MGMAQLGLMRRGGALVGLALVLAACETTGGGDFDGRPSAPGAGSSGWQSGVTTETRYNNSGAMTAQSQIDPATGQRVITGGSFVIGSGGVASSGALVGNWTLSGDFGRNCSLSFGLAPLGAASGALTANPAGFCNPEYSAIKGWMSVGQAVMLTNGSGTVVAQLSPEGSDTYRGSFNGTFGPSPVTLKRGMF